MTFILSALSEGDKNILGNVIGSLLGTLGAFSIALFVAWLNKRRRIKGEEKTILRRYHSTVLTAEATLNHYIPIMLKNARLLKLCAENTTPGHYMMTLPRMVELPQLEVEHFRNSQLSNEWLTQILRAKFINTLMEDFTDYYKTVRDKVHSLEMEGQKVNVKPVAHDHQQLVNFANETFEKVSQTIQDAKRMLAILQLHGEVSILNVTKFNSLKKLENFELEEGQIIVRAAKLNDQYNIKNVLSSN